MTNSRLYALLTILHVIAAVIIWLAYCDDRPILGAITGSVVTGFWLIISIMGYIREDKIVRQIEEELRK